MIFLPVAVLFTGAVLVQGVALLRRGFGLTWLLAVLFSLATWGLVLAMHWLAPEPLFFISWLPLKGVTNPLAYVMDDTAWCYSMALAGLAVGVIVTVPARLRHQTNASAWTASLAIVASGLLAVLAGSPLALALSWTLIDSVELVVVLRAVKTAGLSRQAVVAFAARLSGTLVLMGAMLVSQGQGQLLILSAPVPEAGILLLVAAGLRLGVLPLHLPYAQETPLRRGVGTVMRLVSPAGSLPLLARLPATAIPTELAPYLLGFAVLAGLYGAGMWLAAENEIRGRPYLLIAAAAMAVACTIRSYPQASMVWGVTLILSGGVLFLYSARRRSVLFIPALGVLGMSGLPFTPAAAGWAGLVILPFGLPDIVYMLIPAGLMVGYVRHALKPVDDLAGMELWVQGVYPLGLMMMVLTGWLISLFSNGGLFTAGVWWAGLSVLILTGLGTWGLSLVRHRLTVSVEGPNWLNLALEWLGPRLAYLLSLEWVYRLMGWIYRQMLRFANALTIILEGEGGILWVFVMMALMVSLLLNEGTR